MFGNRMKDDYRLHNALEKVRTLTNDLERLQKHVGKLTQQVEQNTIYGKRNSKAIEQIREATGIDEPGYVTFSLFPAPREIKAFNLSEKVNAILQHLGLAESVTQPNKLIPAPKKEAEKK